MRILPAILVVIAAPLCAEQRTVQVLATSDLHGNLLAYDYYTARPVQRGLAKLATLIRAERAANPNSLLVDVGDTIQGTPLAAVHQEHALDAGAPPEPMMAAMNALGYDAMVIGNHEFNFGLANVNRAREAARFPWLSANTIATAGAKPFAPYIVKDVGGVRVAFIGITTPAIPTWEKPENYRGYSWRPGKDVAAEVVAQVRQKEKADVVVLGVHAGLEVDLKTGAPNPGSMPGEDMVHAIATQVPGVDAIVFGHTHQQMDNVLLNGVLLTQPKNWGIAAAKMEFVLEREGNGPWRLTRKTSRLLPARAEVAEDPEIAAIAKPYHERTEAFLNRVVTETRVTISAARARIEDSAAIDAIHKAQMHYAKADVSLAAAFNPRATIAKGPVTVRQIAALYIYENELFAVQGNGRILRQALENAARYFNTCADADCSNSPLINRNVFGYNFEMAQGVNYDIDLTQPEGSRVRNLTFRGKPVADDQPLRIAVNNYRAGGSGGYTMFKGAPVLWRSYEDIRDLIIKYYSEGHSLPEVPDNNWRVLPAAAQQRLAAEVSGETRRTREM